MNVDYLIVGSGLTGAVIARILADAGQDVLVVERRPHMGGNVHDHCHPSGIRIHTYGPHYFRTDSQKIWDFVTRFSTFYRFEATVMSQVDNKFENWPPTARYINRELGAQWQPAFSGQPSNFEEASLAMMPQAIYQKFVKGYTEKQWGVSAATLAAELAGRFEVRANGDHRLKQHRFQGLPLNGYANFMANMLADIPVLLNFDYLHRRKEFSVRRKVIFTGAIDEFFGYKFGKLNYRYQIREHEYLPDVDIFQPVGQVNNPNRADAYVRTLEWKHMMPPQYARNIKGTVITRETPATPNNPNDYEYPFPDRKNKQLYRRYRQLAAAQNDLLICGRLGEYRYYDMDHAIGRAMEHARTLLAQPKPVRYFVENIYERNDYASAHKL